MKINKNVRTIAIEGVAGCGKTVLIRYLTRDLLEKFCEEDFVIIGRRLGDYSYFQGLGELIILDEENELESALKKVLNYESRKIIILSELFEEDIRKIGSLITKNKKHLIIIEAQSLPIEQVFDLEFIGRNTLNKGNVRNLDLNIDRGQYWINDVILFNCPFVSEKYVRF